MASPTGGEHSSAAYSPAVPYLPTQTCALTSYQAKPCGWLWIKSWPGDGAPVWWPRSMHSTACSGSQTCSQVLGQVSDAECYIFFFTLENVL